MNFKTLTLLAISLLISSCGFCNMPPVPLSGQYTEQTIAVMPFTSLEVSHNIRVVMTDSVTEAHVYVDSALVPFFVMRRDGNEIEIGFRRGTSWIGDTETIVYLPWQSNLNDIELSGASVLELTKTLSGRELDIDVSGASIVYMDMNFTEADIELSGASIARLTGSVVEADLDISGASQMLTEKSRNNYLFSADVVEGSVSGASIARIHANRAISCSVSGASQLYYTGNANTAGSSTSGASSILHE